MRLSNYLADIDWTLRETLQAISELRPLHARYEIEFAEAEELVEAREKAAHDARNARDKKKERFRDVHQALSELKQHEGELRSERFRNAEDEESWDH